jgi:CrcB protein
MLSFFLVFIGGSIGATLRYLVSILTNKYLSITHWGTFIINIVGCIFLGFVTTLALNHSNFIASNLKLFLTTGIAGGFTTFSTFGYENITLLKNGDIFKSLLYVSSSFIFGLLAICGGYVLANLI